MCTEGLAAHGWWEACWFSRQKPLTDNWTFVALPPQLSVMMAAVPPTLGLSVEVLYNHQKWPQGSTSDYGTTYHLSKLFYHLSHQWISSSKLQTLLSQCGWQLTNFKNQTVENKKTKIIDGQFFSNRSKTLLLIPRSTSLHYQAILCWNMKISCSRQTLD